MDTECVSRVGLCGCSVEYVATSVTILDELTSNHRKFQNANVTPQKRNERSGFVQGILAVPGASIDRAQCSLKTIFGWNEKLA